MECLLERLKPEELILPQDLVQQDEKQIGDHHPAYPFLHYYFEVRKEGLPKNLQPFVSDDWVWYVSYPFLVLCRLSATEEVVPTCWVKTSELHRLSIATSDIFELPPELMEREFEQISTSWSEAYPTLKAEGVLVIDQPPDLGEWWLGMVRWRQSEDWELRVFATPVVHEWSWTPLYRFQDINRISTILSEDSSSASAFGGKVIRDIRDETARIRKKYGLVLTRSPRTYRGSRTAQTMQIRREVLKLLKDSGYSVGRVIIEFGLWSSLASEIEERLRAYTGAGVGQSRYLTGLTRELDVPTQVIEMVLSMLGRFSADEIDKDVFGRDERTLRRDWEALNQ